MVCRRCLDIFRLLQLVVPQLRTVTAKWVFLHMPECLQFRNLSTSGVHGHFRSQMYVCVEVEPIRRKLLVASETSLSSYLQCGKSERRVCLRCPFLRGVQVCAGACVSWWVCLSIAISFPERENVARDVQDSEPSVGPFAGRGDFCTEISPIMTQTV